MKRTSISLILCASIFVFSCKNEGEESTEMETTTDMELTIDEDEDRAVEEIEEITVDLEAKSGSNLSGYVTFTEEDGEVRMQGSIKGLSEGTHAIHIHEKADCSAEDGSSAGGHWNPTNEPHGEWGDSEGFHRGDIGNFQVDGDGVGNVSMSTDLWCIGCEDEDRNILGKAIIVHDGVDDYTSQPSGDAGMRVGCGEIEL